VEILGGSLGSSRGRHAVDDDDTESNYCLYNIANIMSPLLGHSPSLVIYLFIKHIAQHNRTKTNSKAPYNLKIGQ
jgi:hypothetical protein